MEFFKIIVILVAIGIEIMGLYIYIRFLNPQVIQAENGAEALHRIFEWIFITSLLLFALFMFREYLLFPVENALVSKIVAMVKIIYPFYGVYYLFAILQVVRLSSVEMSFNPGNSTALRSIFLIVGYIGIISFILLMASSL